MFNKKNNIIYILVLCLLFLAQFTSAKEKLQIKNSHNHYIPVGGDKIAPSNYSDPDNWLALPKKENLKKKVDIFFIYPTSWRAGGKYPVSDINNQEMRQWAQYYLKFRATAFETSGNIFAPYYRQLDALFADETGSMQKAYKYFQGVPKTDIIAAFDFYIKNFNNGRPFILAGHSQGSIMIREILFDYMKKNPDVYKRMIAAYAIGIPMLKEDYEKNPHVRPALGPDDTGVVISYNTEAPVVDAPGNPLSVPNAILINPISWKTTDESAGKNKNIGSLFVDKDNKAKKIKRLADAKINPLRGTIVCSTVEREQWSSAPESRAYFPLGVFHENDIPLYYYNLRKNAENRVKQYFKIQKKINMQK
ncbi:MAG: DUF3089 domain-containing protein [Elusimicrobiota bacterium]|nr:DUF3089 domain-containing protein [Elusimicrobiota bacterium]